MLILNKKIILETTIAEKIIGTLIKLSKEDQRFDQNEIIALLQQMNFDEILHIMSLSQNHGRENIVNSRGHLDKIAILALCKNLVSLSEARELSKTSEGLKEIARRFNNQAKPSTNNTDRVTTYIQVLAQKTSKTLNYLSKEEYETEEIENLIREMLANNINLRLILDIHIKYGPDYITSLKNSLDKITIEALIKGIITLDEGLRLQNDILGRLEILKKLESYRQSPALASTKISAPAAESSDELTTAPVATNIFLETIRTIEKKPELFQAKPLEIKIEPVSPENGSSQKITPDNTLRYLMRKAFLEVILNNNYQPAEIAQAVLNQEPVDFTCSADVFEQADLLYDINFAEFLEIVQRQIETPGNKSMSIGEIIKIYIENEEDLSLKENQTIPKVLKRYRLTTLAKDLRKYYQRKKAQTQNLSLNKDLLEKMLIKYKGDFESMAKDLQLDVLFLLDKISEYGLEDKWAEVTTLKKSPENNISLSGKSTTRELAPEEQKLFDKIEKDLQKISKQKNYIEQTKIDHLHKLLAKETTSVRLYAAMAKYIDEKFSLDEKANLFYFDQLNKLRFLSKLGLENKYAQYFRSLLEPHLNAYKKLSKFALDKIKLEYFESFQTVSNLAKIFGYSKIG